MQDLAIGTALWIISEPREANANDTFKSKEDREKALEELRRQGLFQGIGESDIEYEARRQCALVNTAACK